ncbi:MAG: sirohydrochlorin chelatase [Planctomycetes bacterium]|nr:sirohydrochlorin chelatase [Planctomycetota bacterium]
MSDRPAHPAVLLVGHGTRDQTGQQEFLCLAQRARERLADARVQPAFLELAAPSIAEGLATLDPHPDELLIVVPVLLFAARHVKRDIPDAIEEGLRAAFPSRAINVRYASHLGCDPELLQLSAARFWQAYRTLGTPPLEHCTSLFVGRGTSDPDAIDEACRFTELRHKATPTGNSRLCFVAAQPPSLATTLRELESRTPGPLIVQPHLLFHGHVLEQIRHDLRAWADANHGWDVGFADHLGPDPALVELIERRVRTELQANR